MGATLGIDTATSQLSVCTDDQSGVISELQIGPAEGGRPRHATELLGAIETATDAAGGWPAVSLIAAGIGPGTFTGLRIGVATARALAQASGVPLAGVSSLAALGAGIAAAPEARNRLRLALLDAKRGEVFAALTAADGRVVWEECVIAPDRLGLRLAELDQAPICAGDGALRFSAQLLEFGAEVLGSGHPAHIVHARHICELGRTVSAGPPDSIEPTYLRRPDAELWIERDTA